MTAQPMKTFMRSIHIKRILKISALVIVGTLSLLLVGLAFLPVLVSSHVAQTRIQKTLSSSMKRQVVWSSLVMTWSDGLTLSGLRLGDGPAPLLKSNIDQIVIAPSFGRGSDGLFGIDLAVRIRNVRAELAPGPSKPSPPPTKDPLTLLAESIQKVQGLDFPLPVDVRVQIEIAPLQASYRAPMPGKQLRLQDFSFRFAMPSLAAKPITAEVNGRVSVDGREMGKVSLNAKVTDIVTKERRIRLASALFAVDASAPGTSITLSGGLSQADGFAAHWKLDLPGLLAVAQPFVPPTVPKLAGKVEFQLRAKTDKNRDLHAALTIDGAGLAASGGSLKTKQFGPLDLKLQQQIATDHTRQRVDFPGGTLVIPSLIDAAWSASVNHPTIPERSMELQFGPLRLDLARALSLAAPFLPPNAPVKDLAGEATLRSLSLHLNGHGNNGDLAIAGLCIKLPHVRLALKKGELTAEDIVLLLEKAESPLAATLPTRLTADLLWSIKRAGLSGAQPLTVQGAQGKVGLEVTDLNLKSTSPRKVAASATMKQTFDVDRASLGTLLEIEKTHEQLRFLVKAGESGDIEASLPEFAVSAASLQGIQSGKRFGPIQLSASLTAAGIRLPARKGERPALQRATAVISASDFLQLAAEAAFSATSPQLATTTGNMRLDLRRLMPFAAPFVPSELKADGVVNAVWDLAAPLPEKVLAVDKHPLRSAKAGLALFDKLELGLKFDNISATIPSDKGAITVSGLHTRPDLRIVSTKKGESARFDGGVLFSGLSGLPGEAGKLPSQHGSFAINGELSGWSALRLHEELRIDPLAVSHEAELNVSRIDALLDEKQPFSTATLIKRLDATLFANVEGAFSRELKQLLPSFDVAGNISSGVRIDLSAGRELAVRCSLKTKDFGVQLANGTKVEGLRSDIAINRVYVLAASQGESWTPLSAALVRPSAVTTANPGAAEIVGRIHDDLRGARSFSIRRVTTKATGVPLELTALEGDLLFTQEKSGLSFFQADLLGGTFLARGVFDLRPEVPVIAAASSFSNLDITYLLPKETSKRQVDQDAEITGEMSLTAPLTAEQRELFEQLRLALNLRKIGTNTIERALFSLDPYERNEQLVAQRKMLRLGALKGLRANAVDGAFSMEGEALIKGVAVDLPKVERLRISELPLRQELVKYRGGITALRGVLDLVRADTLVIGPKGELSLKRRMYAQ
jgi:translocation and assembly module TamB